MLVCSELPPGTDEAALKQLFEPFGVVEACSVVSSGAAGEGEGARPRAAAVEGMGQGSRPPRPSPLCARSCAQRLIRGAARAGFLRFASPDGVAAALSSDTALALPFRVRRMPQAARAGAAAHVRAPFPRGPGTRAAV
jgi:hypothetical protein